MLVLLRTILLSTVLLVAIAPVAGAAPKKPTPGERMVAKINKVRDKHGLRPLRTAPKLMRSSRGYARHLVRSNSFAHGSSYARTGFRTSGETLALTRGWRRKPWPALRLWLRSSGHRALVLSSTFRYIGVGPARGHVSGPRTTVWVAHFGAH